MNEGILKKKKEIKGEKLKNYNLNGHFKLNIFSGSYYDYNIYMSDIYIFNPSSLYLNRLLTIGKFLVDYRPKIFFWSIINQKFPYC